MPVFVCLLLLAVFENPVNIKCRHVAIQGALWVIRLLTNFLCLPDCLICLSRIDQAERFAWYQACLILIRQQPDWSGCCLILIWHVPDRSGSCLILIRQQPDRSGCRLILIWHVPDRSGIAWYQAGKWYLICLSRIFDPAPKSRRSGNLAWYVKNLRLA